MKRLVVYFSRTGNNRIIAETLAGQLSADLDEIHDQVNRQGRLGWIRAGRDSARQKTTEITVSKNPQEYDEIIIGGPKWAFNLIPPLRTYARQYDFAGKRIGLFAVTDTGRADDIFATLGELLVGAEVVATLSLKSGTVKENQFHEQLEQFLDQLRAV